MSIDTQEQTVYMYINVYTINLCTIWPTKRLWKKWKDGNDGMTLWNLEPQEWNSYMGIRYLTDRLNLETPIFSGCLETLGPITPFQLLTMTPPSNGNHVIPIMKPRSQWPDPKPVTQWNTGVSLFCCTTLPPALPPYRSRSCPWRSRSWRWVRPSSSPRNSWDQSKLKRSKYLQFLALQISSAFEREIRSVRFTEFWDLTFGYIQHSQIRNLQVYTYFKGWINMTQLQLEIEWVQ